jgi:hypothetical protein
MITSPSLWKRWLLAKYRDRGPHVVKGGFQQVAGVTSSPKVPSSEHGDFSVSASLTSTSRLSYYGIDLEALSGLKGCDHVRAY